MSTDLIRHSPMAIGLDVIALDDRAKAYARQAMAPATAKAYAAKWQAWIEHCGGMGFQPLPADPVAVANWLAQRADSGPISGRRARAKPSGQALSTLRLTVAAVKAAHSAAGHGFDTGHPARALRSHRSLPEPAPAEPSYRHRRVPQRTVPPRPGWPCEAAQAGFAGEMPTIDPPSSIETTVHMHTRSRTVRYHCLSRKPTVIGLAI